MHDLYAFVSGPLVWIAFIIFSVGCIYRITRLLVLTAQKEKFIFSHMSWKYSLRSIFHWLIPFGTMGWKENPLLCVVTFVFHFCLLVAPLFLLAHMVLVDESWDLSWWTLPEAATDVMTVLVVLSCAYFLVRRISDPKVRYVTSASDYVILLIVAAPFITGFFAYHQWFGYDIFVILHILAGEVMLVAIPFTRLGHMVLSPFTRAYMGSEFGKVRHAIDW